MSSTNQSIATGRAYVLGKDIYSLMLEYPL